jgi:hypothetical protein
MLTVVGSYKKVSANYSPKKIHKILPLFQMYQFIQGEKLEE